MLRHSSGQCLGARNLDRVIIPNRNRESTAESLKLLPCVDATSSSSSFSTSTTIWRLSADRDLVLSLLPFDRQPTEDRRRSPCLHRQNKNGRIQICPGRDEDSPWQPVKVSFVTQVSRDSSLGTTILQEKFDEILFAE